MKKILSVQFTQEQIAAELKQQSIISKKGDLGAYLLYVAVTDFYRVGVTHITGQIFKDCGFNTEKFPKEIAIGDYYLIKGAVFFLKYDIKLNQTLRPYMAK